MFYGNFSPILQEAEEEKVIHLGKLKTAEYRLLRRMRDRAKQFARSAGDAKCAAE